MSTRHRSIDVFPWLRGIAFATVRNYSQRKRGTGRIHKQGPGQSGGEEHKLLTINKPANPKAKNRKQRPRSRTAWLVCRPEDREALAAIGEPCLRDWREGEPVVTVRNASSLTPGARR